MTLLNKIQFWQNVYKMINFTLEMTPLKSENATFAIVFESFFVISSSLDDFSFWQNFRS